MLRGLVDVWVLEDFICFPLMEMAEALQNNHFYRAEEGVGQYLRCVRGLSIELMTPSDSH